MSFSDQLVKAQTSISRGYDGTGRTVAILDTGIDVNHPDLRIDDDKLDPSDILKLKWSKSSKTRSSGVNIPDSKVLWLQLL